LRDLFVKSGVDLVDHFLEGNRLIENGTLLNEALCVVKQFGFVKAGILLYDAVEVKFTNVLFV
jgi:hypothetical protein